MMIGIPSLISIVNNSYKYTIIDSNLYCLSKINIFQLTNNYTQWKVKPMISVQYASLLTNLKVMMMTIKNWLKILYVIIFVWRSISLCKNLINKVKWIWNSIMIIINFMSPPCKAIHRNFLSLPSSLIAILEFLMQAPPQNLSCIRAESVNRPHNLYSSRLRSYLTQFKKW